MCPAAGYTLEYDNIDGDKCRGPGGDAAVSEPPTHRNIRADARRLRRLGATPLLLADLSSARLTVVAGLAA